MKNKITQNIFVFFLLFSLLFVAGNDPVQAAEFVSSGSVDSETVIEDDLFISGDQVVIDGQIDGNLLASGNVVTVNGEVNGNVLILSRSVVISDTAEIEGSLFAGASTIVIGGKISGSVFGGSAALTLNESAEIGRNIYYGGYSLEAEPGSQIGVDLFAGVYQALLKGTIDRDVKVGAGAVELNGSIGRDAEIDLGNFSPNNTNDFSSYMYFPQDPGIPESIDPGLRVDEGAVIRGQLVYSAGADLSSGIKAEPSDGIVANFPTPKEEIQSAGRRILLSVIGWFLNLLRELITLLVLGLLMVWLIPSVLKPAAEFVRTKPLPAAGYGALVIFVGSIAVLLAAGILLGVGLLFGVLTLGGLGSVVLGLGFSVLLLIVVLLVLIVNYGSKIAVAYFIGSWFLEKVAPNAKGKDIWSVVAGVLFLVVLSSLPFVGWLVGLAATLVGTGAFWLYFWNRRKALPEAQAAGVEITEG